MTDSDRIEDLLEELVAWTRFAHREAFVQAVRQATHDPRHLRALESTDGTRTQGEIATLSGLSQPTVSRLWIAWRRLGLVKMASGGKAQHLVRPSDIGIPMPGTDGGAPSPTEE